MRCVCMRGWWCYGFDVLGVGFGLISGIGVFARCGGFLLGKLTAVVSMYGYLR